MVKMVFDKKNVTVNISGKGYRHGTETMVDEDRVKKFLAKGFKLVDVPVVKEKPKTVKKIADEKSEKTITRKAKGIFDKFNVDSSLSKVLVPPKQSALEGGEIDAGM